MGLSQTLVAFLAVGVISFGASANPGHEHSHDQVYGQPGDPKKPARIVEIVMREDDGKMTYTPDRIQVRPGEQVRFRLRNDGVIDHEFVLATVEQNLAHMKAMENAPDMAHDEPNARRLEPGTRAEIVWRFTRAGAFDFSCLIPGHRQLGMSGTIVVR